MARLRLPLTTFTVSAARLLSFSSVRLKVQLHTCIYSLEIVLVGLEQRTGGYSVTLFDYPVLVGKIYGYKHSRPRLKDFSIQKSTRIL